MDLVFDAFLPEEVKVLPGELAALDELLRDPSLLEASPQRSDPAR